MAGIGFHRTFGFNVYFWVVIIPTPLFNTYSILSLQANLLMEGFNGGINTTNMYTEELIMNAPLTVILKSHAND